MVRTAAFVHSHFSADLTLLTVDDNGSGRLAKMYERMGYGDLGEGAAREVGGAAMARGVEGGQGWGDLEVRWEASESGEQ